jgi:hypothetical protein
MAYHPTEKISFVFLQVFSSFFSNLSNPILSSLYFLFIIGFVIIFSKFVLSIDLIRNKNSNEIRSDFFVIFSIIFVMGYFIFYQRGDGSTFGEPRWYYPLLLATFICISRAMTLIWDISKKYHKFLPFLLLILLIGYGGYYQINHANEIITAKIPTYVGIRSAGLFLNEISNFNDIIVVVPVTQASYYSERKVMHPNEIYPNQSDTSFESFLSGLQNYPSVKYLIVSFSEPNHPSWMRNEGAEYGYNSQGQVVRFKLEIPFMDTIVNFQTGEQNILNEKTYDGITFKLINIAEDCFVYQIIRK